MRDKGLSRGSISPCPAAIISFLELKDIVVIRKKLNKFICEDVKTIRDEAYTHSPNRIDVPNQVNLSLFFPS